MNYLLDTSTCIIVLRKGKDAFPELARQYPGEGELSVSSVVVGELFVGLRKQNPQREEEADAIQWLIENLMVLPFDVPCADEYSRIRAELETAGTPIGGNDLMIAATASAYDLTVVTKNVGEFSRVSGLKVENWAE